MSLRHALLLQNFVVIDGTGGAPFVGDVRVRDGRIVEVGRDLSSQGQEVIAGSGRLALSPGFIDVHTHDDAQVLLHPEMVAKVSQGVTTVVVGNCGLSLVPLVTRQPPPPLDLLATQCYRFGSFKDYVDEVNRIHPAVNVAALVGHTALRASVMSDFSVAASLEEIERMGELLSSALTDGALGLSSGVFYQPAYAADTRELVALCRLCASHQGVYVTHIRTELEGIMTALQEAADTAQAARVPLIYSHHKCAGPKNWGRTLQTLALIDRLSQRQELALDTYPYTAGSTLLREDLVDEQIDILITRSEPHPEVVGEYLAHIAKRWELSQLECARRLMPGGACYFQVHEDDLQRVLRHPKSMIGSDGLPHDQRPHPRLWGTFPRVLGHYARDLGLMPLEQAVHKMTGLSAERFGLTGRGVIKPGAWADLVVFDSQRVRDRATYEHPTELSEGILQVYVAGQLGWSDGRSTGRHGRFVKRGSREE